MLVAAVAGKGLWLAVRGCWRHRGVVAATIGVLLFVDWFGLLGLGLLLGGLALVALGRMAGRSGS
ncbi:hypothetical protein FRAAL0803 [Frankia alni ACN14a]|uniref:Uncharacterized protein n=2 Tax=Frankiaceae TaxID=74712 RepID=Q0RSJ0_FRAAA|nr:hypothetical protein FRAAL0803 [Frankia alni ACN14a]